MINIMNKKKFYWPPLLMVFLACCFSALTIVAGETSDMEGYLLDYYNATQVDLPTFLTQARKEPIFSGVTYFISYLTSGEQAVAFKFILPAVGLILVGTGTYNLCRVYIRHAPAIIITTSIMAFPILLEASSHLVRQIWSLGICLLIIRYESLFLLLIAAGIHLVSLISTPLILKRKSTIYIVCLLVLYFIFNSNFINSDSAIVQLTYLRLFSLLGSIGDVQLRGLSVFSFFILLATPALSYIHQKKCLSANETNKFQVSRRMQLFIYIHFSIIITSFILNYTEMTERLIYNLYPIFLLLLGLWIEKKERTLFLLYGACVIPLFLAIYVFRNF